MKLTEHFDLKEFTSKDGAPTPGCVIINLIEVSQNLEVLREYIGKPIKINSGYRSPAHNKAIGGVKGSQHTLGKASDIVVKGMKPKDVANAIEKLISKGKMKQGGIGRYSSFTHYDIRGHKARWVS